MKKVYFMKLGNTLNADLDFKKELKNSVNLREVSSVMESDVVMAFVPIVSRAGTDIEAALKKIPEFRPVVLVVLHYTFDPYFVAPNSRRCVNNTDVFTVDCLFHEDRGLLRCQRNDEALRAVKDHLEAGGSSSSNLMFQMTEYARWMVFIFLFILMAPMDKFFHIKWHTRILLVCIFLVILYIYDIEELIFSTLFPSTQPANTDTEQKPEMFHNLNPFLPQNISVNISQTVTNHNTSKNIDQNITQN
ncbi:uncharacterized protein LOC111191327 [Astyanax mexicanus]|uniref:uncharacterized protein LOC111191327 n=1 Tax=Astyanax mexicanus TaxID=7994 RepID=UPI0020CB0771|nr:uncharacterized protein LOC111191327 [Astyanax mexicanus]